MFDTLAGKVERDRLLPERAWQLDVLDRVLHGTIYDVLKRHFHEEQTSAGEYIPVRDRRPSVRYNLCKLVVDDSTSMLFGEGRFPTVTAGKEAAPEYAALIAECGLQQTFHTAAWRGSIGSSAILFRLLKGRPFFDVMPTKYLTPMWRADAPDTLDRVTERYRVSGEQLVAAGYQIAPEKLSAQYWFQRIWDDGAENWFEPWPVDDKDAEPQIDGARTVEHKLGFVPIVWMRNLPSGDKIDGACTFRPAIETQIEIDYQLSQAGRGLKYSSEPTLMIKEPAAPDDKIVRSAANALIVSTDGDAKLLEINGTAANAVVDYVKFLREMALEQCHGNRSSSDKLQAAQSGRALELLHQPLLQLADVLRGSYGSNGLLPLMRMVAAASKQVPIKLRNQTIKNLSDDGIGLRWPAWFSATPQDKQQQAGTLGTLRSSGHISRETAVKTLAPNYDIEDPLAEIALIEADEAAADARDAAQVAAQTKITESTPG